MWKTYLYKWMFPAYFAFLGALFGIALPVHEYFALFCYGIACVISIYYLIALLKKRYPKPATIIKRVFTTIICIGLSIFVITESFILYFCHGSRMDHDYVIILGAGFYGDLPSIPLSDRIEAAHSYLTFQPDVIAVISGGQGSDEKISEARYIYQELIARDIAPERLWLEENATSTWENIKFSLDLIQEKTGSLPERIGIISSEYHLFRAALFAKDCGVAANGLPARTSFFTIKVNNLIREFFGVWHYFLLGGQYQ